jgi:hypothetical protein
MTARVPMVSLKRARELGEAMGMPRAANSERGVSRGGHKSRCGQYGTPLTGRVQSLTDVQRLS